MEAKPRLVFDRFEIDLRRGCLAKDGRAVRIQPKPFTLLAVLISRAGDTVTRDELRRALWPADTHVAFETGLNTAVRKVRRVLADEAAHPRYVQTIPGVGYRFIAPVSPVEVRVEPRTRSRTFTPGESSTWSRVFRPGDSIGSGRAAILTLLLVAGVMLAPAPPHFSETTWRPYAERAHQYLAMADRHHAIAEFEMAVANGAEDEAIFIDYACVLGDLKRHEDALSVIERGLARRPQSATLRAHRGLRLHAVGRYDEELAALTEAVTFDPQSPDAQFHLGLGLARRRDYGPSLAALQRAVDLSDGSPYFLSWLGRIAADAGRLDEAEAAMRALQRRAAIAPVSPALIDAVAHHVSVASRS